MPCCAKLPCDVLRAPAGVCRPAFVLPVCRAWAVFRRFLTRGLLLAAVVACAGLAWGAEISVRNAQLAAVDEHYSLSAEFGVVLNGRLEEAVNKGVVLHFVIDFELTRGRWYWFDEQIVRRQRTVQLAYLALTRQYRVSAGKEYQTYASLGEALRAMSRLNHWSVLDKGALKPEEAYQAALQMRLDLSQMPKTFQVSALSNKDWVLASGWWRWVFVPREALAVPAVEPPHVPAAQPLSELPGASGGMAGEAPRLPQIVPTGEAK